MRCEFMIQLRLDTSPITPASIFYQAHANDGQYITIIQDAIHADPDCPVLSANWLSM